MPHPPGSTRAPSPHAGVTLDELVAVEQLHLQWVSGQPAGGGRRVRWAHSTDLVDPSPYLKGGDLVCTVGVALTSAEACRAFVATLAGCDVAALCFGVGDVHPRVPDALREACAEHGLPLIVAPWGAPFEDVTEYLAERQVAAEAARNRREQELLTGLLAGVRARADTTGLLDLARAALPGTLEVQSVEPHHHRSTGGGDLTSALGERQVLVWEGAPAGSGQALLDQIARVMAVAAHERDIEDTYRWERVGQLVQMVGDGLASPAALRSLFAEADLASDLWVASAWPSGAAVLLAERLPDALVGQTRESTMALTSSDEAVLAAEEQLSLPCGYGSHLPLAEISRSIKEARAALQLAQKRGHAVGPEGLTTLEGLLEQQPTATLRPFVDELILPIVDADRRHRSTYLETLRVFLRNNGSLQETASECYLHVNTVRKRLERIGETTGRNPWDFSDRAALAIALWAYDRRTGSELSRGTSRYGAG